MARGTDAKLKLLFIADILSRYSDEDTSVTMEKIIALLNQKGITAERKSIYRDICILKEYGLQIEYIRGKDGGYRLVDRKFEVSELKLLVDAVQASKFITEKKSNMLIKKLESFLSKSQEAQLQHTVIMHDRIKSMNESVYYNVDTVQTAINANRKISFLYFDKNVKKEKVYRHNGARYTVEPIALTWDDENYYLVAFDGEMNKHYRVDKMEKIEMTEEPISNLRRERFDTAKYSKKMFGMYGGETVKVVLRADEKLAQVFFDRFGQNIIITPEENTFVVTVEVALSPVFYSWIMQFGKNVTVIAPEIAKTGIKKLAQEVLGNY